MGPLKGIRVLEFEAIGPAPFCGMMLADMGADVLLLDRPEMPESGLNIERRTDVMFRGRRSIALNLKSKLGALAALALAERADVVIEGYRPGVMERLGLGPDQMLARNPKLVYGRVSGWGQSGPLSRRAGHDINYLALSGILNEVGRASGPPVVPLNLVADFGGGGMLIAVGICAGLLEAQRSGKGQVVDAAMIEGASLLATMYSGLRAAGRWGPGGRANALNSSAPWYGVYETKDGKFVAVGAVEAKFYAALLKGLNLEEAMLPPQNQVESWPELRSRFAGIFRSRTRDEWSEIFGQLDACVSPVLSFAEAARHPQSVDRKSYVSLDGIEQPAPAPRFSRSPSAAERGPPERGEQGRAALESWGLDCRDIEYLAGLGLQFTD